MVDIHIDMDSDIREILERRADDLAFRAIVEGDPHAQAKLTKERSKTIALDLKKHENFGPRQVESFLRFMDEGLDRAVELAEMDNVIYDGLGEHRILGKKKKKKKKMRSY